MARASAQVEMVSKIERKRRIVMRRNKCVVADWPGTDRGQERRAQARGHREADQAGMGCVGLPGLLTSWGGPPEERRQGLYLINLGTQPWNIHDGSNQNSPATGRQRLTANLLLNARMGKCADGHAQKSSGTRRAITFFVTPDYCCCMYHVRESPTVTRLSHPWHGIHRLSSTNAHHPEIRYTYIPTYMYGIRRGDARHSRDACPELHSSAYYHTGTVVCRP